MHWISAQERLPEPGVEVLVNIAIPMCDKHYVIIASTTDRNKDLRARSKAKDPEKKYPPLIDWEPGCDYSCCYNHGDKVTHWMYIPKLEEQ